MMTARRETMTMVARKVSLVGRRSGTLLVLSVTGGKMRVRCDCGVERDMFSTAFYRANISCGDRVKHPRARDGEGISTTYSYVWHSNHSMCDGWTDVAVFREAIGPRESDEHWLGKTTGDVAACGECADCAAIGTTRNVTWIKGGPVRTETILFGDERVSQAEAARRLGITREAMRQRVAKGTPINRPAGVRTRSMMGDSAR